MMAIASPADPRTWSGTPHSALRQLRRHFPVSVLETPRADLVVNRCARLLRPIGWDPLRERPVHQLFRALVQPALDRDPPDLLFGIMATHKILPLRPDCPVIIASDGLFGTMVDYYNSNARMSERSRRLGNLRQQQMIDRASAIMLTSDWAADDARRRYRIPAGTRLLVAPIGPNMPGDPARRDDRGTDPLAVPPGPPRLLFVGFDWVRKGGPDVLALYRLLQADIPDLALDIVGCTPAEAAGIPGVTAHGVLDKSDPADFARLMALYRQAHLFAMLSRQEAYGVVYAEASAFGLPSIARRTGGVPTLVADGVNGLLCDADTPVTGIAARVLALLRDAGAYAAMRARARHRFETLLNWDVWGDRAAEAVETAIRDWPAKAAWLAGR